MVTRETPAAKAAEAAPPQKEPRDTCALATIESFLTQEEMVLVQTGQTQKQKSHMIHLAPY